MQLSTNTGGRVVKMCKEEGMPDNVPIDAGPLVALLDRTDDWHVDVA